MVAEVSAIVAKNPFGPAQAKVVPGMSELPLMGATGCTQVMLSPNAVTCGG